MKQLLARSACSVLLFLFLMLASASLWGQDAPPDFGPKVGEKVPSFSLYDQSGKERDLASLMGPKGLVVLFSRSADW